jgi:DNA repair protein RecN (Recombination protein N)
MIRTLELKNILLFESLTIPWQTGLTFLTGETGSGKSVIFSALGWILGEKADICPVREGEKMGSIEALFDVGNNPRAFHLLQKEQIECTQEILLRREFFSTGKSRIFINDQHSSLSFLRTLGQSLADRIGQNAHKELLSSFGQRQMLDLFGGLDPDVHNFSSHWKQLNELGKRKELLLAEKEKKTEEEARLKGALKEIEELRLQPDEEKRLIQEEKLLQRGQEVQEKIQTIQAILSEEQPSLLFGLKKIQQLLSSIANTSPSLSDNLPPLQNALAELEEFHYAIRSFQNQFVFSQDRLSEIEERLSSIFKIKRKYGESEDRIASFQKEAHLRLAFFEQLQEDLLHLEKEESSLQKKCDSLANELSEKRRKAARLLEKKMNDLLPLLNMEKALFSIQFATKERGEMGDEEVIFFLQANSGEAAAPLSLSASGGEMARIFFALKTLLSENNETPLLIFDEIDSNVGGTTATIIGEKLLELSKKKQIFAITHFVQVARFANQHYLVYKEEKSGRTYSFLQELTPEVRAKEYRRMLGIDPQLQGSNTKEFTKVL